jgi:hypothetical protein
MKWISILFFLTSLLVFSADEKDAKHKDPADQNSKAIDETEAILDKRITALNERLMKHTKLFMTKLEFLPAKTLVYKGVAKDDECVPAEKGKEQDLANNCIKIEVFDFQKSEEGKSELNLGSRSKYLVLFFEAGAKTDEPATEEPGKLKMIKSKVISNLFVPTELKISEVTDASPHEADGKKHDETITVFYQYDGLPMRDEKGKPYPEKKDRKGYGLYKLGYVENTKTNPIRNTFKQSYYIKHLDQFDKFLTSVFDTNDRNAGKRYKESNKILKDSLVY